MNTYVYDFEGKLYINLTNRCSNDCTFCLRQNQKGVGGHNLWMAKEPETVDVIKALENFDISKYSEIVFCGYGEPTYKIAELCDIAKVFKAMDKKIRLNTNGLGNAINKENIVPKLKGTVDVVSISLNAKNAEDYNEICRPMFGLESYSMILDFAAKCVDSGIKTILSIVDTISEQDIKECEETAKKIGAEFRVRKQY